MEEHQRQNHRAENTRIKEYLRDGHPVARLFFEPQNKIVILSAWSNAKREPKAHMVTITIASSKQSNSKSAASADSGICFQKPFDHSRAKGGVNDQRESIPDQLRQSISDCVAPIDRSRAEAMTRNEWNKNLQDNRFERADERLI